MSGHTQLQLRWALNPALAPQGGSQPPITLSAHLDFAPPAQPATGPMGVYQPPAVELLFARLASSPLDLSQIHGCSGVLSARLRGLRPGETVCGQIEALPGFDDLEALMQAALRAPAPLPSAHGIFVIACDVVVVQSLPSLFSQCQQLQARGWTIDVWASQLSSDLSALQQLAQAGQGALVLGPSHGGVHQRRLCQLMGASSPPVEIQLRPQPQVRITTILRVTPTVLCRGLSGGDFGETLSVPIGRVGVGSAQQWLFDVAVAQSPEAPQIQTCPLLDLCLALPGASTPWQSVALQRSPAEDGRWLSRVEVAHARALARLSVQLEQLWVAFVQGQGRRLSKGLAQLADELLFHGEPTLAGQVGELRRLFLRTGRVHRSQINALRVTLAQLPLAGEGGQRS